MSRYGRRYLAEVLAEHDLLLVQHAILSALDDFGPLAQQQLADSLDLDKSHLVGRIDHLERRALVERAQDPTDRRRHRVTLTTAGKALIDELRPAATRSQQSFLGALAPSEQETLLTLLHRGLADNDGSRLAGADAPRRTPDDETPGTAGSAAREAGRRGRSSGQRSSGAAAADHLSPWSLGPRQGAGDVMARTTVATARRSAAVSCPPR